MTDKLRPDNTNTGQRGVGNRACGRCGLVRRVRLFRWKLTDPLSWNHFCTACKYLESAELHEYQAKKNRATAARLRAEALARQAKQRAKGER